MRSGKTNPLDINKIDWDFKNSFTRYSLHKLHWYPASFIPQIPAFLIELFSKEGDIVYDPFCGSGTTLLEAIRLKRRTIGCDINSLAVDISKVKTTFYEKKRLENNIEQLNMTLNNDLNKYYKNLEILC